MSFRTLTLGFLSACILHSSARAALPPEWKSTQEIQAAAPGLTKVRLPLETLGAAQPSLADLRLFDSTGQEVPFLIDQPTPVPSRDLPLERMIMTMEKKKTVITGAVPTEMRSAGFEAVRLFTPTDDFLKPATLEVSQDGLHWKALIHQGPIFKQSGDALSSTLRFAKGPWSYVRITLDDSDTPPLRVSQVRLFTSGQPLKDLQEFEPRILEVASDAHRTEIRLQLPASGLPVDAIRFDVPETTFRRQVRLAGREFSAGEFRENIINQGSIYRITLNSQRTEELSVPIHRTVAGPLVTLTIENGDSPALTVRHVRVKIVPRDLIFDASSAGAYQLCSGNPQAPARDYDVAALRGSLATARLLSATLSVSRPNPAYQPPPPVIAGDEEGSDINTDPWRFRRKIVMAPVSSGNAGEMALWRIELDPQAIAHNGSRLEALRLVRNDKQIPYVIDYAGVERSFSPALAPQTASTKSKSTWVLTLPYAGIPISRLHFTVPETLFQRTMTLYEVGEELPDREPPVQTLTSVPGGVINAADRVLSTITPSSQEPEQETAQGEPRRILASATWTRTHANEPASFELVLQQTPRTARLILETENRDNAPIHPANVEAYYGAPRLVFRSHPSKEPLYLYYGQPEVSAPQYDLNLVAAELLSTPPQEAKLGAEEALKSTPWWEPPVSTGTPKYFFWGVMILVVLGLLVVIARLLPEEAKQS
jgi:hypothetical protein